MPSLIFDADLGAAGDLDIDDAEFVRYYKPSYKNGQLCLRLTRPALETMLSMTSAHVVTHENISVIQAQYKTLTLIEQDIAERRKSWNLWKKLDARRKIPMFVAAAYSLLSLTAMTSREVAKKMKLIPTQQTQMTSAKDISPTEEVTKIEVPLEDFPPEVLSALDEYIEQHQSHENQGLDGAEEGLNDEFSDNASTIRPSTYASSSFPTSLSPTPTPVGDQREGSASTAPSRTCSIAGTEGTGKPLPERPIILAVIEKYYNCTIARDSANMGTSTLNNDVSSPRGLGSSG